MDGRQKQQSEQEGCKDGSEGIGIGDGAGDLVKDCRGLDG